MTTIAYRDGVLAADSRAYSGDKLPVGIKTKIRRLDDGTLCGCSSNRPGQPEAFMAWFEAGAIAADAPKWEPAIRFLAVRPDGSAFIAYDSFLLAGPVRADFYAVGSGEEYALGAMAMGASAAEAVRIACQLDVWSGEPVVTLTRTGDLVPATYETVAHDVAAKSA